MAQIIAQVKERGDEAVREYTVKFDGRAPENLEISKKELKEAENSRAPELLDCITPGSREYRGFSPPSGAAELAGDEKGRRYFRAENPRLAACRPVCAGRHGGVSFLSADERYSGENRRGAGIDNGDSPRKGRKAEPGYFGGGIHCRRRPGVSDGRRSGCGGPGFRYPAGAQGR